MSDLCNDNRFELIERFKKKLIESTNIEDNPEEMKVIDNILFRFWQMGWLDKLELSSVQEQKKGYWIFEEYPDGYYHSECSVCGHWFDEDAYLKKYKFCPNCGANMRGEQE